LFGLAKQHLNGLQRRDFTIGDALVNGHWVSGDPRESVIDPATGDAFADCAWCHADDVRVAIDAAERAFHVWREFLPAQRATILRAWAMLVRQHADEIAVLVTCEQGKPLAEARSEIEYGAGFLDWFAAEGERAYGETIPSHKPESLLHVRMQPIGIVAAITPWNFPVAMIARKAGAALAAGCSLIVKPAPETSLSALALARLAVEAGIPRAVLQVVTGDPVALAGPVLADQRVRAVSFTGSTEVGKVLIGQTAETVKKISLELGGHAPFLIFDDADVEKAVLRSDGGEIHDRWPGLFGG
jgi:aspartate-semialdehyde dehydrogenase